MNKIKNFFKQLWNDESAQGATEYIILLVVVVAIVVIFKDRITGAVEAKVGELGESITGFTGN